MRESSPVSEAVEDPFASLAAPPVFVVGQPRSGTTWVFDVLEAHPAVAGIFESWLFTPEQGITGVFSPAHWDPEGFNPDAFRSVDRPYGLHPLISRDQVVADMRQIVTRWLGRALTPEHRFLVEKSPPHLGSVELIDELLPGSRFVELVRDGRDVCVSTIRASRGWNPRLLGGGDPVSTSARSWGHYLEAGDRARDRLGDRYIRVRFEDLRADPMAEFARIHAFAGIPANQELIRASLEATSLARQPGTNGFRGAGRVGDWRSEFRLRDGLTFQRAAGAHLRRAGYVSSSRWLLPLMLPRRLRRRRAAT